MGVIRIELPGSVLSAGQSEEDFVREAKVLLALKLFELGRMSSGKAAALCDMPRLDFLLLAGQSGIPVTDFEGEELNRELA